jgi:hypothetical protein
VSDPEYVAPARWLFTVLHERDPLVPPAEAGPGREASQGATRCGELMTVSGLWQAREREPGDRVCPRCAGEDLAEEQGSLL